MSSYYIVKKNRPDDDQPLEMSTIGYHNGKFDGFLIVLELIIPTELNRSLRLRESETIPLVDGQPLALTPVVGKIKNALDQLYFAEHSQCSKKQMLYWDKCHELLTLAKNDLERFQNKGFPEEPAIQMENALTDFMCYRRDRLEHRKQGVYAVQHIGTAVLLARESL